MPLAALSRAILLLALAGCGREIAQYEGNDFGSDPPQPGPMSGQILVCNSGDDTLSVIDPAARRDKWRLPVGFIPVELEGPHDVASDPAGRFYFVTLSEAVVGSGSGPHGQHGTGTIPGYVIKFDVQTGAMVGWAQVDPNPAELVVALDGKTVFATHFDLLRWRSGAASGNIRNADSNLAVIDTASMQVRARVPMCPAAHGIEISDDGATLYAACSADEMAVIDVATLAVRRVPLTPTSIESADCDECPYRLSIAPDGTVWVASVGASGGGQGGGTVRGYDPATGAFDPARRIDVCGRATAVAPTGTAVFVVEQGPCGDWVRRFDTQATQTGQMGLTAHDCVGANDLDVDVSGYLLCEGDHVGPGSLVLFDPSSLSVLASIPTGVFPSEMTAVPAQLTPRSVSTMSLGER